MSRRLRPPARRAALATALVAVSLAAGCAGRSRLSARLEDDVRARIAGRVGEPERVRVPFALTPEMRDWVQATVPRTKEEEIQLHALLRAILDRENPSIRYETGYTGTAEEVFATGSANCLAFTQLFVGLARELGLPAYFLRVSDLQSFEKEGDLIVASLHVTAALGPPVARRIIDFAERPIKTYRWVEPISDLSAVALYYSNRGAEELREGRTEVGLGLLRTATQLDPELAEAWVNLGVAERRNGDSRAAEAAYRRALEADPSTTSAYQNLAGLMRVGGRIREATELIALIDRSGNRNPFSYLALGDLSLREGRLDEAERYYKRALRLDPGEAETQAAMGSWALAAGRAREAEKYLRRAQKIDPANPRTDLLQRSLAPRPRTG